MKSKLNIIFILISLLLISSLVTACGSAATQEAAAPAATEEPAAEVEVTEAAPAATEEAMAEPAEEEAMAQAESGNLSGDILVDGSSTVYPITEAMAEEFGKEQPDVRVTVGISGTGGGFEKFCNSETDISDASRPIKPSETELCASNSIEYIELPVAYDGLAVMINPENDWVDYMTVAELKMLWEPAAQGEVTHWNQIRSEWPDEEIHLYGAGTDSGTYDYFTQAIVGEEGSSRGDFQASEDDNVLVQGIAGDPFALGFFGLAYYEANKDILKLVPIDDEDPSNGDGSILPSETTVNDGTYQPLSRPIFIYVRKEAAERPEIQGFVNFYLTPENATTLVREVGYVPLPTQIIELAHSRFASRVYGSIYEGEGSQVGVTLEDLLNGETGSAPEAMAEPAEEEAMAQAESGNLSGDILVDGSSTVYPITEAMAEEFGKEQPDVRVTVGISGTGGGFEKFCNSETDISDASRPIKPSESELCASNSIEYIELPVAYDGLAVMINPENDWVDYMTVAELKMLWEPAAQGEVTHWNQIRSEWPDEEIHLYGAGTDSGTYDYFTQAIVGEEGSSRGDFQASEDDNVLVQGIAGDPFALGFFGLAYYEANKDILKLVPIDDEDPSNGDGSILPSETTVNDGTYQPLSRPIFIYVRKEAAERPEIQGFVNFYLTPENATTLVREVGYVPLPTQIIELAHSRFASRVYGSIYEGEGSQVGVTLEDLLNAEQ